MRYTCDLRNYTFPHICLFKKYILHIVHITAHMIYICGECIIVVYGGYELSFSFWFMITAYDQEIEKDRSIKEVK